jgi:putative heme-binding domain-containing protein
MSQTFLKVVLFVLCIVGFFVYIGDAVTRISGVKKRGESAVGVGPEAGEVIFWGKGKCGTCHSIGNQGSAIRCPNLGESPIGPIIGVRAIERVQERTRQTGKRYTATDYLVETVTEPSAYVVTGFKDEMPIVYQPPISLTPDEMVAVISYLQSLGGTVDVAAITIPDKVKAAAKAPRVAEVWRPYMEGDPAIGAELFFNLESNAGCVKCHTAKDSEGNIRGGTVGPGLVHVAGTRTPQFIIESIINPSAVIAGGYEPMLVITKDGQYITGILKRDNPTGVTLVDNEGKTIMVPTSEIGQKAPQTVSIMPGNFAEILTTKDLHDILAYLMTLQ